MTGSLFGANAIRNLANKDSIVGCSGDEREGCRYHALGEGV